MKQAAFVALALAAVTALISPQARGQAVVSSPLDTLLLAKGKAARAGAISQAIDWASLRRVGLGAFAQPQAVPQQAVQLPLPSDYRLAPGDRLGIYLLGRTQREYDVTLNAQGKAYLPGIGIAELGGLSLDQARVHLGQLVRRYFSEKDIDLLLLSPRTVTVAVVGEVSKPGRYTLSGLQTAFDAVLAAGGPTEVGSLRDVRVTHTDGTADTVDLYQFLLLGEGRGGRPLRPGDVVRVPPMTRSAALAGQVRRTGLYELSPRRAETLADLIALAGGYTPLAYLERVEVSRLGEQGWRELHYVNVLAGEDSAFALRDGDRVRVYSWNELREQPRVEIYGEVRKPGVYPLKRGMRLRDLVMQAGGLKRSAYLLRAELDRIEPKAPVRREFYPLDRALAGDPEANPLLTEYDRVLIRRIPEWKVGPSVLVRGEVMFPGRYSITKDSTRLSEILRLAGGFTRDALLREARLIRPSSRVKYDKEYERLKTMRRDEMSDLEYEYFVMKQNQGVGQVVVDFYRLWVLGDSTQDVILRDGDIIDVPRAPKVVEVTGRVARPGGVMYKPGAGVDYYIARAGGVTWDGHRRRTKVIKATGEILDDEDVHELLPGDIIWVPRKPDRHWWQLTREILTALAQVATVYIVVDRALTR